MSDRRQKKGGAPARVIRVVALPAPTEREESQRKVKLSKREVAHDNAATATALRHIPTPF